MRRPPCSPSALLLLASALAAAPACSTRRGDGGDPGTSPDAGPGGSGGDGGPTSEVVVCPEPVPAPTEGACDVHPGTGDAVLLRGTVLGRGVVFENGGVLYEGNKISCVGCGCADPADAAGASRVDCAGAVISPGLINPHDHLTFTEGDPIDHGKTRYDHRHDWRGSLPAPSNPHGTGPSSPGMQWGEVRMLLGGATSMVGSGRADGLLRNLDQLAESDRALGFADVEFETFSLGDGNEQFRADCNWNYRFDELEASEMHAFLPHVAEGVDDYAAEEFRCQSSSFDGGQDFTERNATHIHSIGLGAADYYEMARDGTRLIWSPRFNVSLYGHTAQVTTFDRLGGVIALGTDWTYSGSANVLRELACADQLNRDQLGGHFSDEALWAMATWNAAVATGSEELIGSLESGKVADLAVFAAAPGVHHRAVIEAENKDVLLVVKAGRVLVGEADVVDGLAGGCEAIDVCGEARAICLEQEIGTRFSELAGEVGSGNPAYPAIFCGVPQGEPTCVPSRPGEFTGQPSAGDADGDGVADAADLCPDVFDPIRPIDGGAQADADGDGQGDACDPTPVGDDLDGDGVPNQMDNCPHQPNGDQADGDDDGKGDICDFCPNLANPNTVCGQGPATEVSIVDIQSGAVSEGSRVRITGAVVTGVWANGVWVQQPGATSHGGIHVFTGPNPGASIGDVVEATGEVFEYFEDTELDGATLTVTGTGTPIEPLALTVAQAQDEAYEGMLVRLTDVTEIDNPYDCSADNPACSDANLWQVNDGIVVYDRLYSGADWSARAGTTAVTGVMMTRFERRRIMPRSAADLTE